MSANDVLIDVSRLIWRLWNGGLATGIDRVCLAYVAHFGRRARAVVQYKGGFYVFTPSDSARLFALLSSSGPGFRTGFLKFAPMAFASARRRPQQNGLLYLNIGHTGLDEQKLPQWIAQAKVRAIHFVHDLIPLIHPEYCRAGEHAKHEKRMVNVLASATGLIGNSQATLDDLTLFARQRFLANPPGLAAWIAGSPTPQQVETKTFDRPHFVIVGTIEGRKNHSLVLHLWQRMARDLGPATPMLLVIGQRGWEAGHAFAMLDRSNELQGHVMELSRCGDEEMASLIAGARALLMPSFAEGFGLPVAEALELGTPVIASDLPVFREFARDIPAYLDPLDGPAWHRMVMDFTGDSPERNRQLKAMQGYQAPTWAEHFVRVDEWLETL